jgi:ubiquitin-conjugating enzyme E2 H
MNIFDSFLPQLLIYPNPADPLNPEAAALLLKEPIKYETKVKDYVNKYARFHVDASVAITALEVKIIEEKDEKLEEMMEEEALSLGDVSELSDTSDIELQE